MKALIQRTAVDCVSIAMKTRDIHTVGEESVLFLNIYEANEMGRALDIAARPESADGLPVLKKEWLFGDDEVSEQEALDMLPDATEGEAND